MLKTKIFVLLRFKDSVGTQRITWPANVKSLFQALTGIRAFPLTKSVIFGYKSTPLFSILFTIL